jgi:transposase
MAPRADSLPTDLAAAHAMIIAQREALIVAEAKAQNAEAEARHRALLIEQISSPSPSCDTRSSDNPRSAARSSSSLSLRSPTWKRTPRRRKPRRRWRRAAAADAKVPVQPFERRKPARRTLPEHLPRERIV